MLDKIGKTFNKYAVLHILNMLAFVVMHASVNTTCGWIHHQPQVPDEAKKYRKF